MSDDTWPCKDCGQPAELLNKVPVGSWYRCEDCSDEENWSLTLREAE